jgi:hypothetical protein
MGGKKRADRSFAIIGTLEIVHATMPPSAGEAGMREAETTSKTLGLALANSLLARDKLRAQIRCLLIVFGKIAVSCGPLSLP